MMKIAVLVSGGGTNLQALIDYEKAHSDCPYKIALVVSNTKNAYALERAKNAGIKAEIRSPFSVLGKENAEKASRDEKRIAISEAILTLCRENKIDAIVLAGYLSVLGGKIIDEYSGRIINLHPALLPKFGGVGMWGHNVHEAVLAAHEKESGCTVHLVDSGCDTGEILVQKKVPVLEGDTPDTLYARIAPKEHEAMVEGVCLLADRLERLNSSILK
ncbi:MAG: phosphoribosylglycinamide formyltransferase [Treponema sp.]|nr:phosphoribosylglycinamide formyltransferase [Treponema sp.]